MLKIATTRKSAKPLVETPPKPRTLITQYNVIRSKKTLTTLTQKSYAELLVQICVDSLATLKADCSRVDLISQVLGKTFFAFRRTVLFEKKETTRTSRPINTALFIEDERVIMPLLKKFKDGDYIRLPEATITSLLYTIAMSFCAATDVVKTLDKKTPATFFELLIAHIVARQFDSLPRKKVKVPSVEDQNCELPTDIVFELGKGKVKFHVPVKLSTRERVIQAWAHQRVLAGLWGESEFKGLLVVLAETKLDLKTLKVTEICLPLQWTVYQRYIARLDRVYYLDIPDKYLSLATGHPKIDVKPLGLFFAEKEALLVR